MLIEKGQSGLSDILLDRRNQGDWWEVTPAQFIRWYLFRHNQWLLGLSLWTPYTRWNATPTELAAIPIALVLIALAIIVLWM